jgi:phage-related protein
LIERSANDLRNTLAIPVFGQIHDVIARGFDRFNKVLDRNRVFAILFQEHIEIDIIVGIRRRIIRYIRYIGGNCYGFIR